MSNDELGKLANQLEMFKKGFESVTHNIEKQLADIEKQVDLLVNNTEPIPKIKDSNKEMYSKLQSMSLTIGELIRRLDIIQSKL